MNNPPCVLGVVLAGGASRRMGRSKAAVILPDGRPMIEHVLAALTPVTDALVIAGEPRGYRPLSSAGIAIAPDLHPAAGPMGGLVSLPQSRLLPRVVIAACDQPLLRAATLRLLADAPPDTPACLRTTSGTALAPLPCMIPQTAFAALRRAFEQGQRSLHAWLAQYPARWLTVPDDVAREVASINTPDDLAQLFPSSR